MKRTLSITTLLIFIVSSVSFADVGLNRSVSTHTVEKKDVKEHRSVKRVTPVKVQQVAPSTDNSDEADSLLAKIVKPKPASTSTYTTPKPAPAPQPVVRQVAPEPKPQPVIRQVAPQPVKETISKDYDPDISENRICLLTPYTYKENYLSQFGAHLGRGGINILTCWVELVRSIYVDTRDLEPFIGTFIGIGRGVGRTIQRLGSGVIDIPSAFVPKYANYLYIHDEPILGCPPYEPHWGEYKQ